MNIKFQINPSSIHKKPYNNISNHLHISFLYYKFIKATVPWFINAQNCIFSVLTHETIHLAKKRAYFQKSDSLEDNLDSLISKIKKFVI